MNTSLYKLHSQTAFGLDVLKSYIGEIILQEQVFAYNLQRFSVQT